MMTVDDVVIIVGAVFARHRSVVRVCLTMIMSVHVMIRIHLIIVVVVVVV